MVASPGLQTPQMQARRPFTVPLERYVILPALITAFALACVNYMSDTRLPNSAYLAFALVQVAVIAMQMFRGNLVAGTMGACLTAILGIAALIERAPHKEFDYSLTRMVYRPEIISIAYAVLLASTCLYHFVTVRFAPDRPWKWNPPDGPEQMLARRVMWVSYVVGNVLMAITVPGGFITEHGYGSAAYYRGAGFAAGVGGLALLSTAFLTFALVCAVRRYGQNSFRYRFMVIAVFASITFFRVLRGSRGGMMGVLATIAFLFYMNSKMRPLKRYLVLVLACVITFAFLDIMSHVRGSIATSGLMGGTGSSIGESFQAFDNPMTVNMLPQSYWHLLHTIDLYLMHVRLNGQTFIDLIGQTIPDGVAKFFGYSRPLNGALLLAGYRIHGGGMFVIAEGFWNFAMVGALVVAGAMALIACKVELWFRRQEPVMSCAYFTFLGSLGFGLYYGLQPFVKALEISVALAFVMHFSLNYLRRRFNYRQAMVAATARTFHGVGQNGVE